MGAESGLRPVRFGRMKTRDGGEGFPTCFRSHPVGDKFDAEDPAMRLGIRGAWKPSCAHEEMSGRGIALGSLSRFRSPRDKILTRWERERGTRTICPKADLRLGFGSGYGGLS